MKIIPLSRGFVTRVDDEKYLSLSRFDWLVKRNRYKGNNQMLYAIRYVRHADGSRTTVFMHRQILRIRSRRFQADHIDHDGLNNQIANLRKCTQTQNRANQRRSKNNTSGAKGVRWHPVARKWQARITVKRQELYLGLFLNKTDASAAYDAAALRYFGEFAYTNAEMAA
jgi:hypothetical protein